MEKPPIITKAKVQGLIPLTDCGGRVYSEDEREDLVRYMIWAAENQRDADIDYYKNLTSNSSRRDGAEGFRHSKLKISNDMR